MLTRTDIVVKIIEAMIRHEGDAGGDGAIGYNVRLAVAYADAIIEATRSNP